MSILNINYFVEGGIIDFFGLMFTKEELVERLYKANSEYDGQVKDNRERDLEELTKLETSVKNIIEKNTDERPHTIRFFSLPDFSNCFYKICCIAKISNNGSTYVFAEDKETLKGICGDNWLYSEIKEFNI